MLSKAQVENESGLYSHKWGDIPNIIWKSYLNIMFKNPRLDCLSVTNSVGKYTVTFHYNASQYGYVSKKELRSPSLSHTDSWLMNTEIEPLQDLALFCETYCSGLATSRPSCFFLFMVMGEILNPIKSTEFFLHWDHVSPTDADTCSIFTYSSDHPIPFPKAKQVQTWLA